MMTKEQFEDILKKGFEDEHDIREFKSLIDESDYPYLMDFLQSDYQSLVRMNAIWLIGEFKYEKALPILLTLVKQDDLDIRFQSLNALKHFPKPEVLTEARKCLQDPEPTIRHEAVRVLAEVGTAEDIELIQNKIDETDLEDVRIIYADALQYLKDRLSNE